MSLRAALISVICAAGLCTAAQTPSTTPELEYVMQLRVTCDPAIPVGATSTGSRLTIPINGGSFSGPRLRGEVLKGGADFQLHHADTGRTDLEALYNIRTDDGVTIHVRNRGLISSDGQGCYFYTQPVFEAPVDSPYAWLNNAIYVCRPDDKGIPDGVVLNVWRVRDPYDSDNPTRQPDTVSSQN